MVRPFIPANLTAPQHAVVTGLLLALTPAAAAAGPDFVNEVRPVLTRSCMECHGPQKQKSGYRLDIRTAAMRGGDSGERAIVPHDPAASALLRHVTSDDPALTMPPPKSGKPRLTAAEVETLRAWIAAGPAWPDALAGEEKSEAPHWSLLPLVRPAVPPGEAHPVDAFLNAALAEKGLTFSPEADRRTLMRRLSWNLTGLPPSPEEMAAFIADPDPLAYEKLAARLLDSPRHGERWARHWLDSVQFADSHGYEHDVSRDHAWPYRDYVIAAFNGDKAWPRFIREQLAADALFPDEPQLIPALGFLGATPFDLSAFGTAPVTFDYIDRDSMVTQVMAAFVSTTANCARCHTHKFDPIPQEDYYALQAVFAGVAKGDISYDADPAVKRSRQQWQTLLTAAEKKDAAVLLSAENAVRVAAWRERHGPGARWHTLLPETFSSAGGTVLTLGSDGILLAGGPAPEKDTYLITTGNMPAGTTALRLEVLPHDSLPMKGPGRCQNGNLHLSEVELTLFAPGAAAGERISLKSATADFNQTGWGIERALDGDDTTAWGIHPAVGQAHEAVITLKTPLHLPEGGRLVISLRQAHGGVHLIGALRLSATSDDPAQAAALPGEISTLLTKPADTLTAAEQLTLAAHVLKQESTQALAALPPMAAVYAVGTSVQIPAGEPAMRPHALAAPKVVHRLQRGAFDQPREVVPPGALAALQHLPARFNLPEGSPEAARRAALADWLAHPDNVLTWRSIVNRVWHYHFGRGLCDTPGDFGRMGGVPSHPALLDWLAVWFRDEAKGSLKQLHRLIVTSRAYRQSSAHRTGAAMEDADNRLLWRQQRHRLDADACRDFVLAASGRLDLTMHGPGVRHFTSSKGPQATPALDYTAYDWSAPGAGRRSIYRHVWRAIADPFMESLDFPDLGLLAPARSFSVSALQSLTLYNNDFVLHHAAALARHIESTTPAGDAKARAAAAVRAVWLREAGPSELEELSACVQTHGLSTLCRVLFNSNEFLFVD